MNRRVIGLVVLALIFVGLCFLRYMIDRDPHAGLGLAWPDPSYAEFRRTSIMMASTIGIALAVSGVLLQALLRNPLASPFVLGLSSGAGLAVMIAMYVGYVTGIGALRTGTNAVPALIGALLTLSIVYMLGRRRGVLDPLSLVLVGVVIAAMCGALIMFFQRLVPQGLRGDLVVWMMGNIPQSARPAQLAVIALMSLFGLLLATNMGRAMDVATLGDDEARSIGLSIGPVRVAMFLLAGALTSLSVALAGPIAFVGLISPHAARLVIGPQHTTLVPGAALVGASLLVAADAASQAFDFGAGRMPVGVFTAVIGGATFIWLLKTGKGQV